MQSKSFISLVIAFAILFYPSISISKSLVITCDKTANCNLSYSVDTYHSASIMINAYQNPCNLIGGGVYIDYTSSPWILNAAVNGITSYNFSWTDTNGMVIGTGNQIPFYTQWCVMITDLVTGCDTMICQDCTADITALCMCPMIYNPVCGCDGIMYSNYCLADCADVSWTPAVPNGTLGGFLPCTQPTACGVEITGDTVICNLNIPQILTASPNATTTLPVTYQWYGNGMSSNSNVLTINSAGTYCVTQIDANGCTATECINISVQDIPIYTVPIPPIICYGDSIVLEIDTSGLSNITWVPNSLITPPVDRIVDFPIFSQTYVVEATDSAGCDRRGVVFVTVDSCNLCIDPTLINPQIICPAVVDPVCGCDGNTYNNDCEALNWYGVTSFTQGPCTSSPCDVEINNGTSVEVICIGDTAQLEATAGFDAYSWTEVASGAILSSTNVLNATVTGIYIVVATNVTNNCVDVDTIEVRVYPNPLSTNYIISPNPPTICLGDYVTVTLDDTSGTGIYGCITWLNDSMTYLSGTTTLYPTQDTTYYLECINDLFCSTSVVIEVYVDTCATSISSLNSDDIIIYPNPASDEIFINFNSTNYYDIKLIDILGRELVYRQEVNNFIHIKTSEFSQGTYFIRIEDQLGVLQTYKVLIAR